MDWLRLYTDILDDPKVSAMSDRTYRTWTLLLLYVRERGTPGVLDISVRDIAWRLRQPTTAIQRVINELLRLEILTGNGTNNDPYLFKNWSKWQFESDNAAPRMRAYRLRNKQRNSDVTETVTVTPPDTDTDTDTEADSNNIQASPPVDNSDDLPPFEESEEKDASEKKPKTELQDAVNQVKARFPKFAVETWIGKHLNDDQGAIVYTLKRLLELDGDIETTPLAVAEAILMGGKKNGGELAKFNARKTEAEHTERTRPTGNEPETLGRIMSRAMRAPP